MKKFKQITYTTILLFSCLVASPLIYKQIWKTSKEKEKAVPKKDVVIDIHSGQKEQSASAPAPENEQPQTTAPAADPAQAAETVTVAVQTETQPVTEPPQPEVTFVESPPSYFDDALFIGDSRTVGIRDYGTLTNADYFCDVGLSTNGAANTVIDGRSLNDMLSSKTYGKVYVMLGINEVANDLEYTASAYRQLIDTIKEKQPGTIIYVEANLHVSKLSQTSAINNEAIDALNAKMKENADNKQVFYIDINPVFDDAEGNLREECSNDGVHVLAKYYTDWCSWFCINTIPVAAPAATDAPAAPAEGETAPAQ